MLASRGLRDLRYTCSIPGAVLLLIESLGIEGVRGSGRAGQDCQSENRGQKSLHDHSPYFLFALRESLLLAHAIWCVLQLRKDVITPL